MDSRTSTAKSAILMLHCVELASNINVPARQKIMKNVLGAAAMTNASKEMVISVTNIFSAARMVEVDMHVSERFMLMMRSEVAHNVKATRMNAFAVTITPVLVVYP